MQLSNLVLASALFAVSATACDAESLPDSDFDTPTFRGGPTPGDGDLTIYDGPTAGPPSGPVWDLQDDDVINSSTGDLILTVIGDEIYDSEGALRCSRVPVSSEGSSLIEELRDGSSGAVYYTVMGKWVFFGPQDLPNPDFNQLAFTFKDDQVFDGPHADDIVLVTASENIEKTMDMRKLTIATLIDGYCGAPGL